MSTGPQNAVLGDDQITDLPQTTMSEQDLSNERAAAKFSKTAEFARLKDHIEQRIQYYQSFLPTGSPILSSDLNYEELGARWMTANAIITEFNAIIGAYEQAAEAIRQAETVGGQE